MKEGRIALLLDGIVGRIIKLLVAIVNVGTAFDGRAGAVVVHRVLVGRPTVMGDLYNSDPTHV